MAVIDTFLKMMAVHRAERLMLAPEEIPYVLNAGAKTELSMPAVPADLAGRLAQEVVGTDLPPDEPVKGTYHNDDGEEFTYLVSPGAAGYHIEMSPVVADEPPAPETTAAAPVPEAAPSTVATATSPDPVVLHILAQGVDAGASDIFLSSGKPAHMRLHDAIEPLDPTITTEAQVLGLLPGEAARQELDTTGSVDFGAQAQVEDAVVGAHCRNGSLIVARPASRNFDYMPFGPGNYHRYDYSLFHMNVRENAVARVAAFLGE